MKRSRVWLDAKRGCLAGESSHPGWRDLADFEWEMAITVRKAVTGQSSFGLGRVLRLNWASFCDLVIRNIAYFSLHTPGRGRVPNGPPIRTEEMDMADGISPKPPGRARGRPYEKGRSGNPAGRQTGSRDKATLAAAAFLAGESEALTRRAVELALAGDPTALRLCLERILPPCRERTVKFALPPIAPAGTRRRVQGARRGPHCRVGVAWLDNREASVCC
jgi:Family of unknown function (DUF5681)